MGISIMIGNRIATGRKSGAGEKVPAPLIHYDFSRYSNEDFLNNPDLLVKDLTGNGHDLKLYNFAFAGMSGFGGYVTDYSEYITTSSRGTVSIESSTKFKVTEVLRANLNVIDDNNRNASGLSSYIIKVVGTFPDGSSMVYRARSTKDNSNLYLLTISSSGIYTLPEIPANYGNIGFQFTTTGTCDLTIEQLPTYPGGLVSDGVDDYGQCIKGFSLPDDYTVVALRKILINKGNTCLVAKSKQSGRGAFIMEYSNTLNYSYGARTDVDNIPALFSYQTKGFYNGIPLTIGEASDNDTDILTLFKLRAASSGYASVVLYDLRIYDHSLTDEELQLVKDDMMRNYEKNAKPLEGITYVADWDAKGRSNEEDEPMRSQWVDKKTGKVIGLHNFGYTGMSGWNGYEKNWDEWLDVYIANNGHNYQENNVLHILEISGWANTITDVVSGETVKFKLRVSGLSEGITNNEVQNIQLYFNVSTDVSTLYIREDGDYDVNLTAPEGATKFYILAKSTETLTGWIPLTTPITIEQLPLYPGALVGDGIDDYGVTQEAINEEVGTIICHYKNFKEDSPGTLSGRFSYIYEITNSQPDSDNGRMYMACTGINTMIMGEGGTYNYNEPISYHSKIPKNYNNKISLFSRVNTVIELGYAAIYRLILFKEQFDDAQVEFLRWKVEKEYREWCKKNGYNYALNQLTE